MVLDITSAEDEGQHGYCSRNSRAAQARVSAT
jgi:hypothetical protein